jgi:butyryl-CoA dehydrogenase
MLLAQKSYAEGALALVLYCGLLVDDVRTAETDADRTRARLLLDLLTPVAKSWPAQWCLAANDLAIQVLGGAGYTRDHPVEQFYRDNRLNPIHEGTHGIQALDLLGRKVTQDGGAALSALAEVVNVTLRSARESGDAGAADLAARLQPRFEALLATTRTLWDADDPELTLANATVYLEAFGHVVVAWLWLEQYLATRGAPADSVFHAGKRRAAAWFFRWELPKVEPQLALLGGLDRTVLDMPAAAF